VGIGQNQGVDLRSSRPSPSPPLHRVITPQISPSASYLYSCTGTTVNNHEPVVLRREEVSQVEGISSGLAFVHRAAIAIVDLCTGHRQEVVGASLVRRESEPMAARLGGPSWLPWSTGEATYSSSSDSGGHPRQALHCSLGP
jgi:hypothetical protein